MTKEQIINAYCKIRTIDQTIPDDVLDFMKDASLDKLDNMEPSSKTMVDHYKSLYEQSKKCVMRHVSHIMELEHEVSFLKEEIERINEQEKERGKKD